MNRIYAVAFVGRSGTGKTYAAAYLRDKGIPSIDSDDLARRVVAVGSECLAELKNEFGEAILSKDGSLNRKLLASIAFPDRTKKQKLDAITHPYILSEMIREMKRLYNKGNRVCIIEAPALVESGLHNSVDRVVLFKSYMPHMIERLKNRDNISEEQIMVRIDAQLGETILESIADYIVENNGDKQEFEIRLEQLYEQINGWVSEKIKEKK